MKSRKQKPVALKPATSPGDWGKGLSAFRERHDLSWRDLEAACRETISRRSLRRLSQGDEPPSHRLLKRTLVIEALRLFLESKNIPAKQIQAELGTIFCNEEIAPVLTKRAVLPKPAQNFFGLRFDPFTADPRSRAEVFSTPQLNTIANQLEDAINYQHFVAVIGEIGAGKSLLKRRVVDACQNSKGKMQIYWPEFMNMDRVHSGSVSASLLRRFGQKVPRNLLEQADRLKEQLASMSENGIRVCLGFDECHRLNPSFLTALKNFWELGSGGYDRYLGLILFGQPRFENTLRNAEFREITERLDIIHMPSLGRNAWDYAALRLKTAGGNIERFFERDAITRLAEIGNTPLALGNLCNAALLEAYKQNERKVHKGILAAAGLIDKGEPRVRAVGRS